MGAYVQMHEDLEVTNNIQPRKTGGINLGPTGNIHPQIFELKDRRNCGEKELD